MNDAKVQHAARCQGINRKMILAALTFVLSAVVGGVTRDHRARCSFEAKVSIERIGPSGTFAGHRP
jgi:hypothetical protein